jgi:hypothetical protein
MKRGKVVRKKPSTAQHCVSSSLDESDAILVALDLGGAAGWPSDDREALTHFRYVQEPRLDRLEPPPCPSTTGSTFHAFWGRRSVSFPFRVPERSSRNTEHAHVPRSWLLRAGVGVGGVLHLRGGFG